MELGLKRKIEKGIISEEEAKPKFIRGDSSSSMQATKKAEEKASGSKTYVLKRSLVEAVKAENFCNEEAVKKEIREKTRN